MLVSVLITAYNSERYIATAIESVLSSKFTDFEVIIVDDHSTDKTADIVSAFASRDSRIKFFINQQNRGDYPNRNLAASYASGKYLKYVDCDDYIYPWCLDVLVDGMEKHPEAVVGLCETPPLGTGPFPVCLSPKETYEFHFFGPGLFYGGPVTSIINRKKFLLAGGFEEAPVISDIDMWHKLALTYSFLLFPQGLVWKRKHDKQESRYIDNHIIAYEAIKWKYLLDPNCLLSSSQLLRIKNERLKRYQRIIISECRKLKFKQALNYIHCYRMVSQIKI